MYHSRIHKMDTLWTRKQTLFGINDQPETLKKDTKVSKIRIIFETFWNSGVYTKRIRCTIKVFLYILNVSDVPCADVSVYGYTHPLAKIFWIVLLDLRDLKLILNVLKML